MMSKRFQQIAATMVAVAGILSASTAFAERDWNRTTPWNISGPVASAPRDTGHAPQATALATLSEMNYCDQAGPTATTSITSTSSSTPYATFANPYSTLANPYDRNPTTDASGH